MVRRSTDGHIRFSSYNDLQRALSSYSVDGVQSHLNSFRKNHKDVVTAMLGEQRLLAEVQQVTAQALSACYASDVLETMPEDVDVAEMRTTFINRVRQFNTLHTIYDKQLATMAELEVKRKKLLPPQFADKLVAKLCSAEDTQLGWQFVPSKGATPYQLFRTYDLTGATCVMADSGETYTEDKLIGVSLPEYSKSKSKEVAVFIAARNKRLSPFVRNIAVAKRNEHFIAELRANSIKVDRA